LPEKIALLDPCSGSYAFLQKQHVILFEISLL